MLIAQVTDIHIGFERGNPDEPNLRRFNQVLDRLIRGPDQIDLLLLSGDLTEHGDEESYGRVAQAVARCPFPVWPIPGNHDDRHALAAAFPHVPVEDGFMHYVIAGGSLGIVMLDTVEPGRHGGAFCDSRADWLRARLAAQAELATMLVMHHPPAETGIAWMDPDPAAQWIARFGQAIAGHGRIAGIACGHVHRAAATLFGGIPLIVCPSSAPAVALDLDDIDPAVTDFRAMIVDEPPGFALHRWDGRSLVSHFATAASSQVLARYDKGMQSVVSQTMAERP